MALTPSTKSIPLFGGLDTKTDPKYVSWDKSIAASNVRYTAVQSAKKRYGQTATSNVVGFGPQTITNGRALGILNSELLLFSDTNAYGYASGQDSWFDRGPLSETIVQCNPLIRSSGSVSGIASLRSDLLELFAWEDTRGGVWYTVRDTQSGTFTVAPTQLSPEGSLPQIVGCGGYAYIFYTTTTQLRAAQFRQNDLAAGILQLFVITNGNIDVYGYTVCATEGTAGDAIVVSFTVDPAGSSWSLFSFDQRLSTTGTASVTFDPTSATVRPTSSFGGEFGAVMTLVAVDTTNTELNTFTWNPFTAVTTGPGAFTSPAGTTVVSLVSGPSTFVSDDTIWLFVGATAVGEKARTYQYETNTNGQVLQTLYDLQPASQALEANGVPYIVLVSSLTTLQDLPSQQPTYYLCGGTAATILQRFLGALAYVAGDVFPALTLTDGSFFVGLAERTQLRADANGTIYSQSGLTAVTFTFPTVSSTQVVQFGDAALVNSGSTYSYDGAVMVESGFWEFPEGITATNMPYSTGLSAGLYTYCVTYEWTNANGAVCLSAPSYPSPVNGNANFGITVAAGDAITLTVPYTSLTLKQGAQVCIYRTTVSQSGPFYKVYTTSNDPGLTGTQSFTYTDISSDTMIESQQLLYAPPDGSGELENDPPPPFLFMVATKTRAFGVAQDNRSALWYSKPLASGRPAEWSSAQVIPIETAGGDVTALSFLDTQAVVFKRERIYYLPGDGPNAAGQPANSFPQTLSTISTTSGCINSKSVLAISAGVYFQSELGLENLNRSVSVDSTFGLPVQAYGQLAFSGATAVVSQNQLRWISSDGPCLVFDYIVGRWSTYTNYVGVGYVSWGATAARLTAAGRVFYEDTSTYLDANQPVVMSLETAWIKIADFAQGYAAVWYAEVLGTYRSAHTLNIAVYYDYLNGAAQLSQFDAATNGNFGTWGSGTSWGSDPLWGVNLAQAYTERYQPRIALQRQVCEAIKFKVYDSSITGASCDLNEIALQLGVIGGLNRVPASQQV